ncbi:MAG TPA: 2-dehydro-3-deoxygalactonokinase [Chitinophagaceae bacterium]
MKSFLSCDWGVSTFRLRYVQTSKLEFDSVENPDKGIAATFGRWHQSGKAEEKRFPFYRDVIADHIILLEHKLKTSLKGASVVVSGMASSSIGMIELPYKKVPFKEDGSDLQVMKIKRSTDFEHDILIISGAKTNDDVMRGEETQLAGCHDTNGKKKLYIFPGTHSKHVLVKKHSAVTFKTYMTGEFFELLSKKSILSSSLRAGEGFSGINKKAFARGVMEAQRSTILHSSFLVRTNQLIKKWEAGKNYYYLSGLLIGAELTECAANKNASITLVASGELRQLYLSAMKTLGLKENLRSVDSTLALIQGQLMILKNIH